MTHGFSKPMFAIKYSVFLSETDSQKKNPTSFSSAVHSCKRQPIYFPLNTGATQFCSESHLSL